LIWITESGRWIIFGGSTKSKKQCFVFYIIIISFCLYLKLLIKQYKLYLIVHLNLMLDIYMFHDHPNVYYINIMFHVKLHFVFLVIYHHIFPIQQLVLANPQ
jgi:hypothetical protein